MSAPGPDALPARVDVAVVGGGLAGLAAAAFLAEGGAAVAVLEAREGIALAATGRSAGLCTAGLLDPPHRLLYGLGDANTREVLAFSLENAALLREACGAAGGDWRGSLHAALGEREAAEMAQSVEVALRLGLPCELWDAERVNAALGSRGVGPGRFVPGDGRVDPAALARGFADRARAAGAVIATGTRVSEVRDDLRLVTDRGEVRAEIRAELIVYAGGAVAAAAEPYFEEKLYPVRAQVFATAPADRPPALLPWRAQAGYLYGAATPEGGYLFGGARWATPHLEVGETDEEEVVEAIHQKLAAFAASHFPDAAALPVARRRAGIMAFTCDGLPFVGALPGQPRKLACLGWNGRGLSLAVRAARAVADAALEGRADGLPACFRPGRML